MQAGAIFHIYNHANGFENLFIEHKNYYFFLEKVEKYILPIANIYAYCLMPNHFHLMVKINAEETLIEQWTKDADPHILTSKQVENKISKCFSNLFSSYAQSFNKLYKRRGSLFIPSMKTACVDSHEYFINLVKYIHTNPVYHGFTQHLTDWEHHSFMYYQYKIPSNFSSKEVIDAFGGWHAFMQFHDQPIPDGFCKWE